MKITNETIISYINETSLNITVEDFSKHLQLSDKEKRELIIGKRIDFFLGDGKLFEDNDNIIFEFESIIDNDITFFLEQIFKEKYLLRVDKRVNYGNKEYIEIEVFDMNKTILNNIINIDKSELTPKEMEIYYMKKYEGDYYHDGYVKNFLVKKIEFNKDEVEGQTIEW